MESLQRIHFPLMAVVLLAALAALPSDITCEIFAASEKVSGPVGGIHSRMGRGRMVERFEPGEMARLYVVVAPSA